MIRSLLSRLAPPAAKRFPQAARPDNDQDRAVPVRGRRARLRDWAELLRVSALFTVPGDALAGAAAAGVRPGRNTAYAIGASLCLYEAGMALNDWADRDEDAVDRPHRPLPSGRISPRAALGAAGLLTAAGLTLAARAGRPALAVASALTATVWAYDLRLKHTPMAPAAMAAARALDLLLGAVASTRTPTVTRSARTAADTAPLSAPGGPSVTASPSVRAAAPAAAVLAAHTYAVTAVSRHEAHGGSPLTPLTALGATTALGLLLARTPTRAGIVLVLSAASYVRTAAVPLLHAALNPSPPLTQRAVGGGIRAMIPLQAALAARSGSAGTALTVLGLVPLARTLARRVSPT